MIGQIGYLALVLTFVVALYGAGAAAYGAVQGKPAWVESARHAMLLTFPLLSVTALAIILLLTTGQYGYEYVAAVTSNAMPVYLKITALVGRSGRVAALLVVADGGLRIGGRAAPLGPRSRVSALGGRRGAGDAGFLPQPGDPLREPLCAAVGDAGRRERSRPCSAARAVRCRSRLATGRGSIRCLRHPGMIIHPPMLYLGFV